MIGCPLLCEAVPDPCSSLVISCPGMTSSWRCSELVPEQVSQCVPSSCVTPEDFPWPPRSLSTICAHSGEGGLCHHAPKRSHVLKGGLAPPSRPHMCFKFGFDLIPYGNTACIPHKTPALYFWWCWLRIVSTFRKMVSSLIESLNH